MRYAAYDLSQLRTAIVSVIYLVGETFTENSTKILLDYQTYTDTRTVFQDLLLV